MPRYFWALIVGFACLAAWGCQGSSPAQKTGDSESDATGENTAGTGKVPGQEAVKPALPILEGVDNYEGSWVLAPHMSGQNVNFWLFRLSPDEKEGWTIESLATEPMIGEKITPTQVKVDGNQIRIDAQLSNPKAQIKNAKINFEGTLHDGKVQGSLLFAETRGLMPAQLLPTDVDELKEYREVTASSGGEEFQKAMREPDPARGMLKVAKTMPDSPLSLEAYSSVFNQIGRWNLTEAEVQHAVADYEKALERWGPRFQGFAEINVGTQLALSRKFIDLAEQELAAGEARLKDSLNAEAQLKSGRLNLRIARNLKDVNGKDDAAAVAAYTELQEQLQTMPYHPELLLAAAEYAEKHGKTDDAIAYYLTIVSLPMLEKMVLSTRIGVAPGDETPRSTLEDLWKEKHGSLNGLDEAKAQTYDREVGALMAQLREKAEPFPENEVGDRMVLLEVFTGTACEPCVAADIAVDTLREFVPESKLIVLNYHNHIPAPDPLTSMDSEERATQTGVQATPSAFVNGAPLPITGGYFLTEMVEDNFKRLRPGVDYFWKLSTDVQIEAKAEAAEGKLTVNVDATGVPEKELPNVRLRLAIVEDNVDLVAPNGIRRHSMVVRTMLGGVKGIAAKKGKLKYELTMPLVELKARQLGYLMSFEQGRRIKFRKKPVDLKPLRLVAFVQNDATKEVLQSKSVPVTGDLVFPEMKLPDEATPAETESPPADAAKSNKAAADDAQESRQKPK